MKYRKVVLALTGAGLAVGMMGAPAVAGELSGEKVHRKSAKCVSPRGKKINISWGDGIASTTVYYNNHCRQNRAIELEFVRPNGTRINKCFVAHARTKGRKQIGYGMPNRVSILSKGRC